MSPFVKLAVPLGRFDKEQGDRVRDEGVTSAPGRGTEMGEVLY